MYVHQNESMKASVHALCSLGTIEIFPVNLRKLFQAHFFKRGVEVGELVQFSHEELLHFLLSKFLNHAFWQLFYHNTRRLDSCQSDNIKKVWSPKRGGHKIAAECGFPYEVCDTSTQASSHKSHLFAKQRLNIRLLFISLRLAV